MIKKRIICFMALLLLLSFCACGKKAAEPAPPPAPEIQDDEADIEEEIPETYEIEIGETEGVGIG